MKLSENWAVKITALLDTGNSNSQTLMKENITGGILNLPLLWALFPDLQKVK